jgi:hypothetical protein
MRHVPFYSTAAIAAILAIAAAVSERRGEYSGLAPTSRMPFGSLVSIGVCHRFERL